MIKDHFLIVIPILCIAGFASCAGGNARYNFDGLRFPASMSAYLYDGENKEISTRSELSKIADFEIEKTHWGILYTAVQFSDGQEMIDALNQEIDSRNGDGIVNLSIQNDQCRINGIFILNLLPFWPGCTTAIVRGEIVKKK